MILLLGGTSETAPLAEALARAGHQVLVSTATEIELEVGRHASIRRRCGRLGADEMTDLVRRNGVRAIVDASHPYASAVRETARTVAQALGLVYLTWIRPPGAVEGEVWLAADHSEAARLACAPRRPVLLTTGSRNLLPYAQEARRQGVTLVARVLAHPESIAACRAAGIPDPHILTGRGPFTVAENRSSLRRFGVGVLVTKDSGAAGGVPAKLEAARLEGCQVVMIRRPADTSDPGFATFSDLVAALDG